MSSLLAMLVALFKFAKLGKILVSAGSIILSIAVYGASFGWSFATGFVALIFFHEMGHYLAARHKRLDVGLPTFIPFVGAWIQLKEQPMDAETEAYVAFAGPLAGTFAAFLAYYWGRYADNSLCMALAQSGFVLNLFNLIPLHPLDGGRITAIISPRLWFLGVPLLIAVYCYHPSPLLIVIAIVALPQLRKAWNYDPKAPENAAYYGVRFETRFEYGVLYLGLAAVLALMVRGMA